MTADFEASNSVTDSPALALNRVTNVLPGVGNTSTIDVTYSYVTYATIAFDDGSLYFLGQQPWNVRFTGAMTQPQNNKYTFTPAKGDVNTPSGPFVAGVRNNANPVSIGPVYGNSAQAALGWR
ncbi:MAG TPA: hypothetical protein VH682_28480 [Gemmataceae bacterium]|jgi:hypothetical protein